MDFLSDFNDTQQKWFWEEYIHGQRHLKEDKIKGFYNVVSLLNVIDENGATAAALQTYAVTNNSEQEEARLFVPVMPVSNNDESRVVAYFPRNTRKKQFDEVELAFLKDLIVDDISDVFPDGIVCLSTLSVDDKIDAVALYYHDLADVNEESYAPLELNQLLVMNSVTLLAERLRIE